MSERTEQFDVVIVGARCAGSPLAAMLATRGLRVCVLDRASFPSDSLSTHVIQPCGVEILERLGVADRMLAAGAVSLRRFTLVDEDVRIEADMEISTSPSLCLRRIEMDHLLVETAVAAGATVHAKTGVTDLLWENGRVTGVRAGGRSFRAPLVVGADGRASIVARLVDSPEYHVEPARRLFSWGYFEGAPAEEPRLRLGSVGGIAYLACPTDSGLFMVGVCPPAAARDAFLADREASFNAGIDAWPELAGLVSGTKRIGPIRVLADWHGYFREATGPGWVLLGDAGHFKDPTPAQGISDALRQAERLSAAILASDGDQAALDGEMRRWWRWRDEDALGMYAFATDTGSSETRQLRREILRQLGIEPDGGRLFLRVLNREIAPSRLATPGRLGRAIGELVRRDPRRTPALAGEIMSELRARARRSRRTRSRAVSR